MACLFCRIIAGEIPSSKVYEDDEVFAFNDINPQAPLHVLIVPKRHIATVNDLAHACCVEVPASWSTELTFCATPALKFCATPAVCTALLH